MKQIQDSIDRLKISYVSIDTLRPAEYNPRTWSKEAIAQLKTSIQKHGMVDPLLVNSAPDRKGVVIGGHFRLKIAKELGFKEVPVVCLKIPDLKMEQELNIRLNKNLGEFDWDLLAKFDESFLKDIGFSSEELDDIFGLDETPEVFNLEKELKKLQIEKITAQTGDQFALGPHRLLIGDSTIEADMLKLMGSDKADLCLTDPPYILDYLKGKKKSGKTEGFGYKRDRHYLGTDSLPDNFSDLWMANVHQVQAENFSIICYENWKNVRTIWNAMERYWKVKNMLVWHLPNRVQGFAAKYQFFNKHDIALVGTAGDIALQTEEEAELLQNEYQTALFAISGKPHWEPYKKGNKFCPTDFIEHKADDAKHSGQGIIFGTKPIEILIPYLKVLTCRHGIVLEPFGGSGSTLIAAEKMQRRCRLMEKSPVYAEVIMHRWSKLTGKTPEKL